MQHMIEKMLQHLWMVGLLAVAFTCSMCAFWVRIRRDEKRRQEKGHGGEQSCKVRDEG